MLLMIRAVLWLVCLVMVAVEVAEEGWGGR